MTKKNKTLKPTPQLRARFDQFNCIGKDFPEDGEGLEMIGHIEEFKIGYGFDNKGNIIGWEWNTRYSLTLAESIEYRLAMLYLGKITETPIQMESDVIEVRWLTEILNAMK